MTRRLRRSARTLIALFIVGGIALATGLAEAIIVIGGKFGMFGLARGQTARLNVVRVIDPNQRPGECSVELMFVDSMGMTVGGPMTVDLMRGHAMFLDLAYDALPGALRVDTRVQLRGVVNGIIDPNSSPRCGVVPTVEVYDNISMQTMFILGLTPGIQADPIPHL